METTLALTLRKKRKNMMVKVNLKAMAIPIVTIPVVPEMHFRGLLREGTSTVKIPVLFLLRGYRSLSILAKNLVGGDQVKYEDVIRTPDTKEKAGGFGVASLDMLLGVQHVVLKEFKERNLKDM
eukprot:gene30351-37926_t